MNTDFEQGLMLGADMSKGFEHRSHKYIKREWKNGRWRYYYDDNANRLSQLQGAQQRTEDLIAESARRNDEGWRKYDLNENERDTKISDRLRTEYRNRINSYYDNFKTSNDDYVNGNRRLINAHKRGQAYTKNVVNTLNGKYSQSERDRLLNYSKYDTAKQQTLKRSRADRADAVNKRSKSVGGKVDKFMQKNGTKIASGINKASNASYSIKSTASKGLKKFTGTVGSLANRYRVKKK